MKKRISTYDHIQALVRNNRYLKDLDKIKDRQFVKENNHKRLLNRHEKEENLCKKYNLHLVITPEFAKKYTREQIEGQIIFLDDPVVSVQPQGNANAKEEIKMEIIDGTPTEVPKLDQPDYVLRNRRFLMVEIDLLKDTKDIDKKLKQLVKSYKKYVKCDSAHNKRPLLCPWEIYDKQRSGKNLLQIAKERTGITENPAYNDALMKEYNKVHNAYIFANNLIKKIK